MSPLDQPECFGGREQAQMHRLQAPSCVPLANSKPVAHPGVNRRRSKVTGPGSGPGGVGLGISPSTPARRAFACVWFDYAAALPHLSCIPAPIGMRTTSYLPLCLQHLAQCWPTEGPRWWLIELNLFSHPPFFFSFIFISWRLIILQYCSGFCHTLT